ncbi:hypothetical protein BRADI_2g08290v3 [Brachypodium distachyon]|uniref:Uncharacterized protein n=1 Tax=Brachypodium distachyon TaxID=15368 RepID=A0A2K2D7H2_BRADI|nr:hypothetical protein BRADI_2g08290v3 [Brachypodium distachyon]
MSYHHCYRALPVTHPHGARPCLSPPPRDPSYPNIHPSIHIAGKKSYMHGDFRGLFIASAQQHISVQIKLRRRNNAGAPSTAI